MGQDYLDAGEGFWRLMDAGVVKEAICTSTKKRLQRALHVIDELGRVDRLVDKDLLVPPKGVYGPAHCNVLYTLVVACDVCKLHRARALPSRVARRTDLGEQISPVSVTRGTGTCWFRMYMRSLSASQKCM